MKRSRTTQLHMIRLKCRFHPFVTLVVPIYWLTFWNATIFGRIPQPWNNLHPNSFTSLCLRNLHLCICTYLISLTLYSVGQRDGHTYGCHVMNERASDVFTRSGQLLKKYFLISEANSVRQTHADSPLPFPSEMLKNSPNQTLHSNPHPRTWRRSTYVPVEINLHIGEDLKGMKLQFWMGKISHTFRTQICDSFTNE